MTSPTNAGANNPVSKSLEKRSLTAAEVLQEMEQLRASMRAGDRFPGRHALMQRLDASERSITRALDELARQGKLLKRVGRGGSIVAEPPHVPALNGNGAPVGGGSTLPLGAADAQTVIAITEPDGNIFDQAMQQLMKEANSARLAVACHLLSRSEAAHFAAPPVEQGVRRYLVFRRENLPLAERLHQAGHRVVLVGTPFTDVTPQVPVVTGDQEYGGYLAVTHLVQLGHRRIGLHLFNGTGFEFARDYVRVPRFLGMHRALEEARAQGLDIQVQFLDAEHGGESTGQVSAWGRNPDKVRDYFSSSGAPTAIASWNDDMAIRLLTQLQRAGIRVPEDVSLVGYDNLARGALMHPSLTTVDGLLDHQIRVALRLLTQSQPTHRNHSVVVLPSLLQHESTGRVPA